MPYNPKSAKNLKSRKKGDKPLPGAGKPKGKSLKGLLRELLNKNPKKLKLPRNIAAFAREMGLKTNAEALTLRLYLLAYSRNPPVALNAIKEIFDRTEGMAKQSIDVKNINFEKLTDEQLRILAAGGSLIEAGIETSGEDAADI